MTKDELSAGIAGQVIALLASSERSVRWLARKTGINHSTLRNQLHRNPRALTIANAILIADALDVKIDDLMPIKTAA